MTEVVGTLRGVAGLLAQAGLLREGERPETLPDLALTGVTQDSREVAGGDLFLAWRGLRFDAHAHVGEAAARGAVAAVVERRIEGLEIPQIVVHDGRSAAALTAHALLGRPADGLWVTAVTGTNGKTTVVWLLRQLLGHGEGRGAGSIGTLGAIGADGAVIPGSDRLTTPGPVEMARLLGTLAGQGVRRVALEASSHALEQRRLDGVGVDVACFTNLTQDHLDYHPDLDAYRDAKALLLARLRRGPGEERGGVVLNADPAWAALPRIEGRLLVVRRDDAPAEAPPAAERLGDLVARDVRLGPAGTEFTLVQGERALPVRTRLLGDFNVENALVALGAAVLSGIPLAAAAGRLAETDAPPGRLEAVVREPFPVLLDYAHTPDALARVLETLRPLVAGRLIVVFGAGGDRDRAKRPRMGRAAAEGADLPIVTSDNPRTEDPAAIIEEIRAGMGGREHLALVDRREAIARALELARPGDLVLLAGKGHEPYQEIGTERRPFDERRIARELLEGAGR